MRWLATLVLLGCYAPRPPSEAPCGAGDVCPSGQQCVNGLCVTSLPNPDGDVPDDGDLPDVPVAPADARIDTPPVPPMMSFGDRTGSIANTLFDTFLANDEPATNFGTHPDLHLTATDESPVLIRIDVTMVPSYATVVAARLRFRVTSDSIPAGRVIDVFKMNESWTEGTSNQTSGIANYTERNPGVAWSAAGALPPSREAVAAATTTIAASIATGQDVEIALPPSLIMGWIASPTTNHGVGIIVAGTGFYCELGSSEASTESRRPVLELDLQ